MFKSLTLASFAVLATLSFAHAADAPVASQPMKGNPACAPVMSACKNAGFTRGQYKDGKGLIADCVKPLEEGKTVAGVTVDQATIDACKTAHAAKKAEFDAKMKNDPEFAKKVEARQAKREARKAGMTKAMPASVAPMAAPAK